MTRIIHTENVPGNNSFDPKNLPITATDDAAQFNEVKLTDNNNPLFRDPVNLLHFDIGSLIPEQQVIQNPVLPEHVRNKNYPSWIILPAVSSNLITGVQTGMPEYVEGITPTFSPANGEIVTTLNSHTAFKNAGSYYPDNTLFVRNPNHWLGYQYYYQVEPLTVNPTQDRWTQHAKIYLPRDIFYSDGGPRNNGYTKINDSVSITLNSASYNETQYGNFYTNNDVWKEGSIELTIRPTKSNCIILSGEQNVVNQTTYLKVPNGVDDVTNNTYDKVNVKISDEFNYFPASAHVVEYQQFGGLMVPTPERFFSETTQLVKYMRLMVINNKLVFEYCVPFGANKKRVYLDTNFNIVDNNWHHVVINRTNGDTQYNPGIKNGGEGALEIWIDGQLVAKTYEITMRDNMPNPHVLFNDEASPAWIERNFYRYGTFNKERDTEWILEKLAEQNYEGDISDYIFRQSYSLNPQEINLNKTYAFSSNESKLIRAEVLTANITMNNVNITSNKKKALKLYWNNLLVDKTKILNGVELDNDMFDVYTYSVTNKNILSPSQNLNLDNNYDESERFFYENVRVAVKDHVFIIAPQVIHTDFSMIDARIEQSDSDSNEALIGLGAGGQIYATNMLVGGVELKENDRILLLGQQIKSENGIWIYNGPLKYLTRPVDIDISNLKNAHVYVEQGNYAGTTWVQTNEIKHLRKSKQTWIQVDNDAYVAKINSYPLHTLPWQNENGMQRFIDVNQDIAEDFDVIAFMNYPTTKDEIYADIQLKDKIYMDNLYIDFINNLKSAVNNGKSLYVSSPLLAIDLGIVSKVTYVDQLHDETGDAHSAALSPFESGEPAEKYFNTHRNMKYQLVNEVSGLTNKPTYIMTDFVTYNPNENISDYHIKYSYRQFGLQEGDEFYIPGLTTIPETLNQQLPGYTHNQIGLKNLAVFNSNDILMGTPITEFSNNIYSGSTVVANPYDDYVTTIAVSHGEGKMFVNCVENGYAFSRPDYNKGIIQNVTIGQNNETVQTAAWQYSTLRLNKKDLYDFSENANIIGQTVPSNGGGGGIVQSQSHCSNGMIRRKTNENDLIFTSDLYPDFTEEYFETTEIPVLSMTWLGLLWLAE